MEVSLYADPDYRLWVILERSRGELLKARGAELSKYGVSAVEAFALFVIHDIGGNATPAEVSRRVNRGHNTVTALMMRMERKGLVTRVRDSEKKNGWRVSLTDAGEAACEGAMRLESIHTALSGISDVERQVLESALKGIYERAFRQTSAPGPEWDWTKMPD